ncbi:MAG: endonuclease III [Gammaproteobacteria bacterium]|nr:endonuclease III [Gammaproteobacteria bacterium]
MEKVTKEKLISYLESIHNDAKCALNYNNDYELLVSIMLSAQTTDVSVNKVTKELFSKYKTIEELSNAKEEDVMNIIHSIGLYKNKSKSVIIAMKKLNEDGFTTIPNDFNYLVKLPGVGRKTANVFLSEYYDENTLGVDTHILRISKRLRIASKKDGPIEAETKLKRFIGDYNTKKFHHMMISFGRNECKAKNPSCDGCPLKENCDKERA